MRKLKNFAVGLAFMALGFTMACGGTEVIDTIDPEVQLAIDIELIEEYLADKGYTDYDTLDSEERVVILEEGTGAPIAYNDIISYNYLGIYLNDTLFDTSIKSLAYDQDLINTIDTTFQTVTKDSLVTVGGQSVKVGVTDKIVVVNGVNVTVGVKDSFILINGKKQVVKINYTKGYNPIYSSTRAYAPFITNHTPDGWFVKLEGSINGFKEGVHYTLENVNINGRVLVLIPSSQGYGTTGSFSIPPNTVLMFELRPVQKR